MFYQPGEVDLLIGGQIFWGLLCSGQVKLNSEGLVVKKTRLGWIVGGPVVESSPSSLSCNLCNESPMDVQDQLERFWALESCEGSKELVPECEEHFRKNTSRTHEGRFMVAVPVKEPYETLGESYESAKRRFMSLERKLDKDLRLKEQYTAFMNEYEKLHHMSEDKSNGISGYYIPHHGVRNEKSSTTKLRVVFDASMPTSNGKSLNNIQMIGEPIQNELFTILIRFRRHEIALCADVEKMYRQVLVTPDDSKFQKVLWRSESSQPLKTYILNTVTYGTAAAPFLATRALYEMGNICKKSHPKISEVIQHDFYVDDMISGANSVAEAIELAKGVSQVLAKGCFPLRKWRTNSSEVIQALLEHDSSVGLLEIQEDAKTLGLVWNQNSDEFLYRTNMHQAPESATKRSVLSTIAKMFDPLGLLGPITVVAKLILQQVWLDKLSWDEELPQNTLNLWQGFCVEFARLSELKVPRHVLCKNLNTIHIHGFSDASEKAYGACVYLASSSQSGCSSLLLCSKSRVAPLKPTSIPRLELCAAHLLAKLVDRINKDIAIDFSSINLWSDSSVVLSWLGTPPFALKTFVRNRVGEVQELTKTAKWRHVPSNENPADLLSRGTSPSVLKEKSLWWKGPSWLVKSEDQWPKQLNKKDAQPIPELRKETTMIVTIPVQAPINITRFSNVLRLQRAFAYCNRFIHNCKFKENRLIGPLSVDELNDSLTTILQFVQNECFHDDIKMLERRGIVHIKSPILNLNPFLEDSLLRVGGRLHLASFLYDKRHPILLPKGHHFTKLIFKREHLRLGHAGPEQMLASVRERYWPISGRNTAKEVFRSCISCVRVNPHIHMPIMGNLPAARFSQSFPFKNTGMDYAGPIMIKTKIGRGSRLTKAYICVFVCLTTRAIHLEAVTALSTEAFLAALKRFISRRGKPCNLYSDNGTNFVGASNELSKFLSSNQTNLSEVGTTEGISFHFIPPRSPHFGGMWEAGVKCIKTHLKRIVGNAHLTFECLYTVLTQIEAVLNSRPLSQLSANPADMEPLTPAHFLIGRRLTSLPERNLEDITTSRLSMYERAQQLTQHFWRRWSSEYVVQLQQRQKWRTSSSNIDKDALVLIKEDHLPPLKWKLGRVVDLHPGKDDVVRVVSVKCSGGVSKRPVAKICPLPI